MKTLQNRHYKKKKTNKKIRFHVDIEVDATVVGVDMAHFELARELAKCYKIKKLIQEKSPLKIKST